MSTLNCQFLRSLLAVDHKTRCVIARRILSYEPNISSKPMWDLPKMSQSPLLRDPSFSMRSSSYSNVEEIVWGSVSLLLQLIEHITFFFGSGTSFTEYRLIERCSISTLVKCTSAIRQLAYGSVPDSQDEYLQIGSKTDGEEYLGKPTQTDIEKIYAYHEEKHGFPCMGYYLTNKIFLECSVLIKYISHPGAHDTKRIRYKQAHEAAQQDVERAFSLLKKKWL
nr:hypothetical protein [Tanacetum cinerariifolium]